MPDKQPDGKNQAQDRASAIAKSEEAVLAFWEKALIFRQSVEREAPKGDYIFYDGPPFITGLPHYATLLPSIAKDLIPRYYTMKGYRVRRVWGWDCHGLPAENKVEKQLGLKNKRDIEALGVDKFVSACRDYVNTGTEQWKWYIDRIARWVDMENAYKTMDRPYMESVIWAFKALYDRGLIYEDYRSSLHCPRCATPLSKFEITMDAGSYKEVNDESVYVKFKISSPPARLLGGKREPEESVFILAWTTTPWTLPGNLALAVGEGIKYQVLSVKGDSGLYIVAKDRAGETLEGREYQALGEIKGSDLAGLGYEPVFGLDNGKIRENGNAHKIYAADFVSTEEGTGIVHIAPNFGEDDFELGKKAGLPLLDLMDENGAYTAEAGEWQGLYFKQANQKALASLGGRLFRQETHVHSYPFCYRCDTRLIYKTQKAWYLRISEIRPGMLATNKKINWIPGYFKEGRFRNNIETAPDWCLSRSRYWGAPIPVWRCAACGGTKAVGSIKELEKLSGAKVDDLHRPAIDAPEIACQDCGGRMKRVKEVLDCWFESGSMPFAQFHFPFNTGAEADFKRPDFDFPADFIIEYTGQLRGWFYYLHALSNALFGAAAFKNVIVSGVLAGTDGRKMSKSYGNYPDPKLTLDKYGADALRMYFMQSAIMGGDDASLNEKDIQDCLRKNVMLLLNVVRFYGMFSAGLEPAKAAPPPLGKQAHILDRWIMSRLGGLIAEVQAALDRYDLPAASRPLTLFIDDLSTWYLRRSRDRFKSPDERVRSEVLAASRYILTTLSKVIAPFMPFLAETTYQAATGFDFRSSDESVHLEAWPEAPLAEKAVLAEMAAARKIVELALSKRDEAGIKVRQPLAALVVVSPRTVSVKNAYIELIKEEVNVKEVNFSGTSEEVSVELDTRLTPGLIGEGIKRELVRLVNSERKNQGLTIDDRIDIYWRGGQGITAAISAYGQEILEDTLALSFHDNVPENGKTAEINGEAISFMVKKAETANTVMTKHQTRKS